MKGTDCNGNETDKAYDRANRLRFVTGPAVFDAGFALVAAAFVVVPFCIFYFHHRKYLSWLDSKPGGENEKPGPTAAYMILTLITAALGLPIAMLCYYFLVPPGG